MARKMRSKHYIKWNEDDIKKLIYYRKIYGHKIKKIAEQFPDRSYDSVDGALSNLKKKRLGRKNDGVFYRQPGKLNPNPPTPLTYVLVHNYYEENIRHGMTRDATIADIAEALNRSPEWVKQALKIDIRKYMDKEEKKEKDYEEMELRHTYIR